MGNLFGRPLVLTEMQMVEDGEMLEERKRWHANHTDGSDSGVNLILKDFNMSVERFWKCNESSTESVKKCFGSSDEPLREAYSYLQHGIDQGLPAYFQFGVDKAGVRDMEKFCELLNIKYSDVVDTVAKFPLGADTQFESRATGYNVYSQDRKLILGFFSKSGVEGYFHYMGITAGCDEAVAAYKAYAELGYGAETSWGGREYI